MANTPKYYVTLVMDCPACEGTGSLFGQPCEDCGATGTLDEPVELAEAMAMIGILPRLEDIERTAKRAAYYSEAMANGGI